MKRSFIGLSTLLSLFFLVLSQSAFADEGMYMTHEIPYDRVNQTYDVDVTAEKIERYMRGVVKVEMISGGHGSGSFISKEGLILTNHHVAKDCYNYLRIIGDIPEPPSGFAQDSFFAKRQLDEVTCPGYQVVRTVYLRDVTKDILRGVTDDTGEFARDIIIRNNAYAIARSCVDALDQGSCRVLYSQVLKRYFLEALHQFGDVRLVYLPSDDIAKFGGKAFDGTFPRYSGDFAFLRAYAKEDGNIADFREDSNIPYDSSEDFLVPDLKDIDEGDFVMVLGYPGQTDRFQNSYGLKYRFDHFYPIQQNFYENLVDTTQKEIDLVTSSEEPDENKLQTLRAYESSTKASQNYLLTMIQGAEEIQLVEKRSRMDARLSQAIKADEDLTENYGTLLRDLQNYYQAHENHHAGPLHFAFREIVNNPVFAPVFLLLSYIRETTDELEPAPEFVTRMMRDEFINASAGDPFNLHILENYFRYLSSRPPLFYPQVLNMMNVLDEVTSAYDQYAGPVEAMVRESKIFKDVEVRESLLEETEESLKALNDPLIDFVIALEEMIDTMNGYAYQFQSQYLPMRQKYAAALHDANMDPSYIDADGSLRYTYGKVNGYAQAGSRSPAISRFRDLPELLQDGLEALGILTPEQCFFGGRCARRFDDMAVNFAATLDITAGNSGSAVLNGDGRVVGTLYYRTRGMLINDLGYSEVGKRRAVSVSLNFALSYAEWDIQTLREQSEDATYFVQEVREVAYQHEAEGSRFLRENATRD